MERRQQKSIAKVRKKGVKLNISKKVRRNTKFCKTKIQQKCGWKGPILTYITTQDPYWQRVKMMLLICNWHQNVGQTELVKYHWKVGKKKSHKNQWSLGTHLGHVGISVCTQPGLKLRFEDGQTKLPPTWGLDIGDWLRDRALPREMLSMELLIVSRKQIAGACSEVHCWNPWLWLRSSVPRSCTWKLVFPEKHTKVTALVMEASLHTS